MFSTNETKENLELIKLLWIDPMANSTEENREFQRKFRDEFHSFEMFEGEEEFQKSFRDKTRDDDDNEMIILILSGRLAQSMREKDHRDDSILFSVDDIEELLDQLDWKSRSAECQLILYRLELIDENEFYLSKMNSIRFDCFDRRILLDFLYFQYESNPTMIERIGNFEHFYRPEETVQMFVKQKCLYQMIFKSLVPMRVDWIYLFRFDLQDLGDECLSNSIDAQRSTRPD